MSRSSEAILAERADRNAPTTAASAAARTAVTIEIYDDLDAIEQEWRRFEGVADCTVFQTFDWLASWQRQVGRRAGVRAAIVLGRRADGELLFLMPLSVTAGLVRRLTWLGCELCDYNTPLLAPDFAAQIAAEDFRVLWNEICARLSNSPQHRFDLIDLPKMPETVGAQAHPMLALPVRLNPSGAYVADLHATWTEFYQVKRSSATRRRDRTKRKRLGEVGEVAFVTPPDADEIARTLDILMAQKAKAFARMGVGNVFARAGHRDFFIDIATNPRTRPLTHVSRLDVGAIPAAVNLGLIFRGTYYHVLASYEDGDIARFGPGAAHLRDLIGYAIGLGCRRFDFTIGDERYKLEWSDHTIRLYDYIAGASPRGSLMEALILTRRRLVRLIKQNPLLWNAFSRTRAMLGGRRARSEHRAAGKSPPIAPA